MPVRRVEYLDGPEAHLSHGMRHVGYDADAETHQYRDPDGSLWQSAPGNRHGRLRLVQRAAPSASAASGEARRRARRKGRRGRGAERDGPRHRRRRGGGPPVAPRVGRVDARRRRRPAAAVPAAEALHELRPAVRGGRGAAAATCPPRTPAPGTRAAAATPPPPTPAPAGAATAAAGAAATGCPPASGGRPRGRGRGAGAGRPPPRKPGRRCGRGCRRRPAFMARSTMARLRTTVGPRAGGAAAGQGRDSATGGDWEWRGRSAAPATRGLNRRDTI